ncbi:MAG: fibronectin type III domain-containing protein, partial [Chitinophagaceae bacterium]
MSCKNCTQRFPFLKTFFLTVVLASGFLAKGQLSTANYTTSTNATSSLVDMSSGTTEVHGATVDDAVGTLQSIGFDFTLMGITYTQFNATSNGVIGLTNTGTSLASSAGTQNGTNTAPIIAPFGGDHETNTDGKVHFKVIGSAPNRVLVVEWKNMRLDYESGTADGTFQALLYETTNVIEFIYGNMSVVSTYTTNPNIGFMVGNGANQALSIASSTNTFTSAAGFTGNSYIVGAITNLNSAADGSRRMYRMEPNQNIPAPATSLSFSGLTYNSMVVNWTASSPLTNVTAYAVYRSTDNVTFTLQGFTANASTTTWNGAGTTSLIANTTYYWRVLAVNEGNVSTQLNGSQSTTGPTFSGTKTIGTGGDYDNLTAAFAAINAQGLAGNTTLQLINGYPVTAETFPINVSNVTATSSFSIKIYPTVTGLSISGSSATGLLNFNNASNVTIDGRVNETGTSKDLIISNTNTTAGAYALNFINEASTNTINYCIVRATNPSTTSGVIVFGTTTGVNGNDNNSITNCDIDGRAAANASPTASANHASAN